MHLRPWTIVFACYFVGAPLRADEPVKAPQKESDARVVPLTPDRESLERDFAKALSGATLVGNFTTAGQEKDAALKEERYTLSKVSKLGNDYWLFQTRIQYGEHDLTLPLALQVKWAGDTPVITLTDVLVPPLGKFTARVIVYRDRYAGTWQGGDHGGHLFGRITRAEEPGKERVDKD